MRGTQRALYWMNGDDLSELDSAIAELEGPAVAAIDGSGRAICVKGLPYRPTQSPAETFRLMDKYIERAVKMKDGSWIAIGPSGRACSGPTLSIAVCRAIVEQS